MYRYFIKTPWWVKVIFPSYIWNMPADDQALYLTFDDGPHPTITPWVLDELKKYEAKATFFCIGNNVAQHQHVYNRILEEGHAIGNHTYHHLNGWKTVTNEYLHDVKKASEIITTNLFRPPYGKVKYAQAKKLAEAMNTNEAKVIMWDVLSADFDAGVTIDACTRNVLKNVSAGSIIVFHDSEKADENLRAVLPVVLNNLSNEGYNFKKIIM
jgi:peptidoglycan/xylan/chitin deacetylase (PgdA/CDA1 family)